MRPYLLFFLFFGGVFSLPKERIDEWRFAFAGSVAPFWQLVDRCKMHNLDSTQTLQLENESLRHQVKRLQELLLFERQTAELNGERVELANEEAGPSNLERVRSLTEIIQRQMQATPARVIFREPSLWSSALWLNVGEKDNRLLGNRIVAKNSPVLWGNVVVGLVEQVEENRCQVRLLTDATLNPSIYAVRGGEQNRAIAKQIDSLVEQLTLRSELSVSAPLIRQLKQARNQLDFRGPTSLLAKGTLQGTIRSKGRARSPKLRGVGFHSHFLLDQSQREASSPLVAVGDLLVTTGLDGVFPADLPIATVSRVLPLREGGCTYEIEALSLAADFDELTDLFVLPSN
jgi:rod shape-determining protein MreC